MLYTPPCSPVFTDFTSCPDIAPDPFNYEVLEPFEKVILSEGAHIAALYGDGWNVLLFGMNDLGADLVRGYEGNIWEYPDYLTATGAAYTTHGTVAVDAYAVPVDDPCNPSAKFEPDPHRLTRPCNSDNEWCDCWDTDHSGWISPNEPVALFGFEEKKGGGTDKRCYRKLSYPSFI